MLSSASIIIEKVLLGEIHLLSSDSMNFLNMSTSNLLTKPSPEDQLTLKHLIIRQLKLGGGYLTLVCNAQNTLNVFTGLINFSSFSLRIKEFSSLKKKYYFSSSLKLCARSHLFICPRSRLGFLARGTCWTLIYLWHDGCFVLVYRSLMYSQNFSICCIQTDQN